MKIRRMRLAELKPADYNPRRDLRPEDDEYRKIKRSLEAFALVEPLIWNENTGRLVGGHQRLKVMQELGYTETDVSVVNLSAKDEKVLNILLNRAKGRWDNPKLAELIDELGRCADVSLTGFDEWELQGLIERYERLDDILDFAPPEPQPDGAGREPEQDTFTMIFAIPARYREAVEAFLDSGETARERLSATIMEKIRGGM